MRILGNLIWFLLGGWLCGLSWALAGILWCVTLVGIPVGKQCFKLAGLSFFPFGKTVRYTGRTVPFLLNLVWIALPGWALAAEHAAIGCVFCVTIVGIPFGRQHFKLAKLALMPFGTLVY